MQTNIKNCNSFKTRYLLVFVLSFVMMASFSQKLMGQKQSISGVVKDKTGEAVIGANIIENGTTNGTVSDVDGNFSIMVEKGASFTVTFLGFKNQQFSTTGQSYFDVTLEEEYELLDAVVVVGYGTMRKKDLTGSITQIKTEKIANDRPNTVQDILRGTPGLNVGFDPSAKGGGSMQIRGQRSVYTASGHNDPLIILDGMIFYGELSEINPDDIGQIDILKDASAAAVYGAKSANGVIIITTKKGAKGKPKINVNSSIGFTTMGANRHVFNPDGYLQYRRDWYTAETYGTNPETGLYEEYQAGGVPAGYYDRPNTANFEKYGITEETWSSYTPAGDDVALNELWANRRLGMEGRNLENYLNGDTFDWYNHSFRTGFNQDYNVSVSGDNDKVNYYLSMGYLSNEGVAKGNDYKTVRSNMKLESHITDWFSVSANVNFQNRTDGDISVDWGNQIHANSPFARPWDTEGNLFAHPMGE